MKTAKKPTYEPHHKPTSEQIANTSDSALRNSISERIPLKTTRTLTKHGTTLVRFGMNYKPAHDAQRHRVSLYQSTSSLEN